MIFDIFKTKPTLNELIPNGFVDIHSHILPGIDDGAQNIKESLSLISEMKKLGFTKIIGTPHTYRGLYDNTNKSIEESFKIVQSSKKIDIEICYASEYMFSNSLIELADENSLLCIKDNYVLIELGFINKPIKLHEVIFQLRLKGYKIILAHPERYNYFFENLETIKKIKKFGCYFQINLLSAIGYYGKRVVKNLDLILENNLVDFVGSDIHNISQIKLFNEKLEIRSIQNLEEAISKNKIFK